MKKEIIRILSCFIISKRKRREFRNKYLSQSVNQKFHKFDKNTITIPNNVKEFMDEKTCTGCGACYNICPHNAINMAYNDEGFLFPTINKEKCTKCNLCKKICPIMNLDFSNAKEPRCYAICANNEIRMKSASGGAFTLIANYILKNNGAVCGATWNENHEVEHIVINNTKELAKLQGVKYIQSNTQKVYQEIEQLLKNAKIVAFVGTPCQVAGLKAFLKKDYPHLYTIDLVCHGVPSPGIWNKYLNEKFDIKEIEKIKFRNKKFGWGQNLEIYLKNGTVYTGIPPIDIFYETFFILMNTRKSCGDCRFATIPRQGDLTIADGWNCSPEMNDNKGTSEILINNKKGEFLFNEIKGDFYKYQEFNLIDAINGNRALTKSFNSHKYRNRFFKLNKKYSVKTSYQYAIKNKYDVGLMGIWYYQNYGSVLTTFSLVKILQELGKEVLLIDNSARFQNNQSLITGTLNIREFLSNYVEISEQFNNTEELKTLNNYCSTFLIGSDQVFNWKLIVDSNSYDFLLDYADNTKKRIAYASSFGDGYCYFKKEYYKAKELLQKFNAISLRENNYIDIVNDEFDINAQFCLDPVFLINHKEFDNLIHQSKIEKTNYALAYILDMNDEISNILKEYNQQQNEELYVISDACKIDRNKALKYNTTPNYKIIEENLNIQDWLYYFKNSSFIITDSFHGVCFSIIFKKNFICIPNKKRGIIRFSSILKLLNLEDRILNITSTNQYIYEDLARLINTGIEYETVYTKLNKICSESLNWLKQALGN